MLAIFTRRGLAPDTYRYAHHGINMEPYEFARSIIFYLMEPGINQVFYGPTHQLFLRRC